MQLSHFKGNHPNLCTLFAPGNTPSPLEQNLLFDLSHTDPLRLKPTKDVTIYNDAEKPLNTVRTAARTHVVAEAASLNPHMINSSEIRFVSGARFAEVSLPQFPIMVHLRPGWLLSRNLFVSRKKL